MITYDQFETAISAMQIGLAGLDNFAAGGLTITDTDAYELVMQPYRTICDVGLGLGQRAEPMDPHGADNLVLAATHRLVAAILVADHHVRSQSQELVEAFKLAGHAMAALVQALMGRYPDHAARWAAEREELLLGVVQPWQ